MMTYIAEGCTILFQGDSVTDAGRSRENDVELGCGYSMSGCWLHVLREGYEF
jgi:hypothetical protein